MQYYKALTETGINVNLAAFTRLSEAAQINVSDETLTQMFKFITDKYNSLDFSEIEKSKGDIMQFKYHDLIRTNGNTLMNIYQLSTDKGAEKYIGVLNAIGTVMDHLGRRRTDYNTLYMQGNGVVQLMYTSLVAGCLYSIGILVSNTIRFVTTESNTECEVLYEEIPGTLKHVHIKNILGAAKDIQRFDAVLDEFMKNNKKGVLKESIMIPAGLTAVLAVGVLILLIPRIVVLIREIIYSIYYSRVKLSDMLDLQSKLIRTNIESLEAGRGNKKVIARQRKIATMLESWKNKIAVKVDSTNALVNKQIDHENRQLDLDKNSPLVQNATDFTSNDLML